MKCMVSTCIYLYKKLPNGFSFCIPIVIYAYSLLSPLSSVCAVLSLLWRQKRIMDKGNHLLKNKGDC